MGGRGPAPKDPEKRRRRNLDTIPGTEIAPDDQVRGPELPYDMDWPVPTRRWWDTWRKSPQAQTFTPTDWDFLLDTAMLHAMLWSGNAKAASELRLRVAKFGATPEDRARLRMRVTAPDDGEPEPSSQSNPSGGRYGHLRVVNE